MRMSENEDSHNIAVKLFAFEEKELRTRITVSVPEVIYCVFFA